MSNPVFDLFEAICIELTEQEESVFTENDFNSSLIIDLKKQYKEPVASEAISKAVVDLQDHFAARSSNLPFEHNALTGEFRSVDSDYIKYISDAQNIRVTCSPKSGPVEK